MPEMGSSNNVAATVSQRPVSSRGINHFLIEFKELVVDPDEPILGKGAFGTVYKAKWRGKEVAVKEAHDVSMPAPSNQHDDSSSKSNSSGDQTLKKFLEEAEIMKKMVRLLIYVFIYLFIYFVLFSLFYLFYFI
jgi:hypothetical protein